ncbi:basic charge Y-linked 2C [Homo sapiens]|uniref:Testis-specific basic protein Y 2 n=4 Tax=Homininae TaxID=207598 RepID=VCY2_HUMAN|eukprot:NP_001002760.1 testis-specific basic protein Y 2 [Homo sapiens]
MMTLVPRARTRAGQDHYSHPCPRFSQVLLTEGIMTYCLTKNLSDVNILHRLLKNGNVRNTLLQSKVGLLTYYVKLYPGEVTLLTRPSIQMRLCCITGSVSRPRSQK